VFKSVGLLATTLPWRPAASYQLTPVRYVAQTADCEINGPNHMSIDLANWRSPDGDANAVALRAAYPAVFQALAEYDRIGHLTLHRATGGGPKETIEAIVGVALLRRGVTIFAGIRQLLESSLADPAVVLLRTYFELWLQYRCLAYGTLDPISLETPTTAEDREPRAARFYVASARRGLRSRALIVGPEARHEPDSPDGAQRLLDELRAEIDRLKSSFPTEWAYFGDLDDTALVRRIAGRQEPAWFADLIQPNPSNSIEALAAVLGSRWEYDFLYDAWSAFAHGRGISKDLTPGNGSMEVHHPHRPTWFTMVAFLALSWHGLLLMTAAKWLTPVMVAQLQEVFGTHRGAIFALEPDEHLYAEFID
jgi:hypothetical protein